MKLTLTRIADLKCPPGKRDMLVFDDEQRGLGVRVTASGGKTFIAQFSRRGQKSRIALGSCAAVSLASARAAARVIMGDLARGIDPTAERRKAAHEARKRSYSFSDLIEDWRALHLAGRSQAYVTTSLLALHRIFGPYLDLPAADLDRQTVVKTIDAISRRGRTAMARQVAAYGRAAFSWALKRGTLTVNPFRDLPVPPPSRRERVLSDSELAAIWRTADNVGPFNAIVRLLMLTGQRRSEVSGMAWTEISGDLTIWTIPGARTKNGATHVVPLSAPVQSILRSAPRLGELVFPGLHDRPFNSWAKAKSALDMQSGVTDWVLHDLRRTVATGLQRLSVRLEVTEQILNHVSGSRGGIAGVYQRHDFAAEKVASLDAWGEHVMAIVEGRTVASNVTQINRASK
jgi:integrase